MIDIHTHIIPALDDGPPDMETSIGMGHIAAQEGTTAIISTSHSEESAAEGYEKMQARLEEVRQAWAGAGLTIRLELGMEIFLQLDTGDELKAGRVWPLAGSQYALVELPYSPWPAYAEQALFNLQLAGYTPILAHPERYSAIQTDPNRMYELAQRGILGQVTAAALLGEHGTHIKHCTETLVRHNMVQFIASDSHGLQGRKRAPHLREAVKAAEALVGQEAAQEMVVDNPARILDHKHLNPDAEKVSSRKWSIGGLFRRE